MRRPFTFVKLGPPTDPQNQDRITDNVWITRDFSRGIFNIAPGKETEYVRNVSPEGTEWAFSGLNSNPTVGFGAANAQNLEFTNWQTSLGGPGQLRGNIQNRPGVMHLIADDIYIDMMFTQWVEGGSFTYTRASQPAAQAEEQVPFPFYMLVSFVLLLAWIGKCFRV